MDLVNAIVRQCSFVDKMYDFGWSVPGFFDSPEDELVLQHAIARYHGYVAYHGNLGLVHVSYPYRFLDLISQSPTTMLVPTLDIDLVWHTHQLMASWYQADCGEYVGRYIDQSVATSSLFYNMRITTAVYNLAMTKSMKASWLTLSILRVEPGAYVSSRQTASTS